MPKEITDREFEDKREKACESFYSDIENMYLDLWSHAEEHGIQRKVFDQLWERFIEDLENEIYENFTLDLDAEDM